MFDPIRQREVSATPEEKVRQSVLRFLMKSLKVPKNWIQVECSLPCRFGKGKRRADILVQIPDNNGNQVRPWLLVECKAERIKLGEDAARQAAQYLSCVASDYVLITNGSQSHFFQRKAESYSPVSGIPAYPEPGRS